MLIQNDPGLEYDVDDAYDIIQKYREGNISFEDLMSNKEIINLKHQAYTSLGSATSISSISMAKDYINAYHKKILDEKTDKEVMDFLENKFLPYFDMFNKDKSIESKDLDLTRIFNLENLNIISNSQDKEFKKLLNDFTEQYYVSEFKEDIAKTRTKNKTHFYNRIMAKSNNPISEYAMALNVNNAIFNHEGKTGEESFSLLKDFYEYGVPSINDSPLSDSVKNLHKYNKQFVNNVIKKYSDSTGDLKDFHIDDFLDDLTISNYGVENERKEIVQQINNAINSAIFEMNKKYFHIANPKFMKKMIINKAPSYLEKNLVENGRAVVLSHNIEGNKKGSRIADMFKYSNSHYNENFYLDDLSLLYDKGKPNLKMINKMKNMFLGIDKRNKNIYFTPEIIKNLIRNDESIIQRFINPIEKQNIAQAMLDAYKYLGEDLTEENALKRLKGGFDSRLASTVIVERELKDNESLIKRMKENPVEFEKYKKRLITNLDNILTDFKNIDFNITNQNIDDSYFMLAKTFADEKRNYKNISSSLGTSKYVKKATYINSMLDYVIKKEKSWLDSVGIDNDVFRKKMITELMNKNQIDSGRFNDLLLNAAKIISNKEIHSKEFKYNKMLLEFNTTFSGKKGKMALGATLGSAGLLGIGKLIKPFFSKEGGKYIAGTTTQSMTLDELYENLNFTNGMKTNLYAEELKTVAPIYTSIKKKNF